jgi:antitoxin component HigA of HigAB toxin-antitoxin module
MTHTTEHANFVADETRHLIYEQESLAFEATELISHLMETAKVSKAELARRIGKSKALVTQMLSGSRNMTMHTFAQLAFALGYRVELNCRPLSQAFAKPVHSVVFHEIAATGWTVHHGIRYGTYTLQNTHKAKTILSSEVTANSWVA